MAEEEGGRRRFVPAPETHDDRTLGAAGTAALPAELPWDRRYCIEGLSQEDVMATNKPVGDNARKGAVKKRSQLTTKTMGKKTFTKKTQ